jgi:tight adherence protein B
MTTLAVLTVMIAVRMLLAGDAVNSRLGTFLNDPFAGANQATVADPQLAQKLNEAINRQGFAERIARDLSQANLPLTVPEYLLVRAAVPLLLALIALFVWRSAYVVPGALIVGFVAPIFWIRGRRKRRNRDFNEQLGETLTMIAGSLRGGFSLVQSLANAAKESQEPTKSELRRVSQEIQLGLSLSHALENLVKRVESDDMDLVVTAIKIHSRVGGNLTTILENISTTIRERTKLRREIRVITSMTRLSSYIIGLLPFALGAIIFAINPQYIGRLFEWNWTLCIPIGAFVCSVIGFLIIQKIVDIKI